MLYVVQLSRTESILQAEKSQEQGDPFLRMLIVAERCYDSPRISLLSSGALRSSNPRSAVGDRGALLAATIDSGRESSTARRGIADGIREGEPGQPEWVVAGLIPASAARCF